MTITTVTAMMITIRTTMTTNMSMATMMTNMTIWAMMTIIFVRKLEVVYKQVVTHSVRYVGIQLLGQLKIIKSIEKNKKEPLTIN